MSNIPYTVWPKKISKYLKKIEETSVPETVDSNWLRQCGFASGNDRYILRVFHFIGFVDSSKHPTELWQKYKSPKDAPAVLAQGIKEGYSELFGIYPDAFQKDQDTLYAFFSSKTGKAKSTVNYMVSTFLNLCALADFGKIVKQIEAPAVTQAPTISVLEKPVSVKGLLSEIHINIQLQLPPSTDPSVYDNLFKSMKKYLLSAEG